MNFVSQAVLFQLNVGAIFHVIEFKQLKNIVKKIRFWIVLVIHIDRSKFILIFALCTLINE
jgi:hypothetical protein